MRKSARNADSLSVRVVLQVEEVFLFVVVVCGSLCCLMEITGVCILKHSLESEEFLRGKRGYYCRFNVLEKAKGFGGWGSLTGKELAVNSMGT